MHLYHDKQNEKRTPAVQHKSFWSEWNSDRTIDCHRIKVFFEESVVLTDQLEPPFFFLSKITLRGVCTAKLKSLTKNDCWVYMLKECRKVIREKNMSACYTSAESRTWCWYPTTALFVSTLPSKIPPWVTLRGVNSAFPPSLLKCINPCRKSHLSSRTALYLHERHTANAWRHLHQCLKNRLTPQNKLHSTLNSSAYSIQYNRNSSTKLINK